MARRAKTITPDDVLNAYAGALFPMGDDDGTVRWYTADPRGVVPLDERFRASRSLRQLVRRGAFEVTVNRAFDRVIRACAEGRDEGTWIVPQIVRVYAQLHREGHAHSVEAWQGGRLVGGLYGVSLGAAFFGESMFNRVPNASKIALHALVARLRERGFELLDAQNVTDHLRAFGCEEVPLMDYLRLLHAAIEKPRCFA